jgi:competence protein ComEA
VLNRYATPRSFGNVIDRRKAEIAAYALGAFVLVLLAARFLHHESGGSAGSKVSVSSAPKRDNGGDGSASGVDGGKPGGRPLVVYVAGEVRTPGVYRVPAGSRADAAVQQAGGMTRRGDGTAVNLAAPVRDGQQIVVPRRGAAAAAGPAAGAGGVPAGTAAPGAAGAAPAQPISLSTATAAQLDTLDGIGPTLAARIIQYRDSHGGFRSVEELRQVDGIGDKRFESLKAGVQP